jgi:hypothetical protein
MLDNLKKTGSLELFEIIDRSLQGPNLKEAVDELYNRFENEKARVDAFEKRIDAIEKSIEAVEAENRVLEYMCSLRNSCKIQNNNNTGRLVL